MSLWKIITNLKFKYLLSLTKLFFCNPFLSISFLSATLLTLKISQKRFPNIHGKHNKANAFRHSLWNILIAKKCLRFNKDENVVLDWVKGVTDLHEDLNPNDLLARKMDLKNNQLGREWFNKLKNKNLQQIELFLIGKLADAKKINLTSKIDSINNLVFLED